jgi:sugar lactone lactonase YvrE
MPVKPGNVFDTRECRLGEGPHYDERTNLVWWVDILGRRILWRAFGGSESGELAAPEHVGAAVPRESGGLLACLPWGVAAVDPPSGSEPARWSEFVRYPTIVDGVRSNDAKADPQGRLWLGTMAYDSTPGAGKLYRLDPGAAAVKTMLPEVTISNGLGWSPDGTTMYYIDTPTKSIDAFEYDPATGDIGGRRRFAFIDNGFPDGMCMDAEGGLWVAVWEGSRVVRFLPDGRVDRTLELPVPNVTSCAFAGPGLGTLIVTTVGPTFAFELTDVRGTHVDRFAG